MSYYGQSTIQDCVTTAFVVRNHKQKNIQCSLKFFILGSTEKIWNYEVAEVHFLNSEDETYINIMLGP